MNEVLEYKDKIAFHPSYYIKEILDEIGLSQKDFAKRLGTTPKNLSCLLNCKQRLSVDFANRLSKMLGNSIDFWLNLQKKYDEIYAEVSSEEELKKERKILKLLDYGYFSKNFNLPALHRRADERIQKLREFLAIASLIVLEKQDLTVKLRSTTKKLSSSNIINANAMLQIAINEALKTSAPNYSKDKFKKAVSFALTQTKNHENFLLPLQQAFLDAGVILVVLPNLKNSGINGATKELNGKRLLMINDRRHFADTFWFTLFHEIGHIMNDELGITFDNDTEDEANTYAKKALIPQDKYDLFITKHKKFTVDLIRKFANEINQDPGIVFGRLQYDKKIPYEEISAYKVLRHTYTVAITTGQSNERLSIVLTPSKTPTH